MHTQKTIQSLHRVTAYVTNVSESDKNKLLNVFNDLLLIIHTLKLKGPGLVSYYERMVFGEFPKLLFTSI